LPQRGYSFVAEFASIYAPEGYRFVAILNHIYLAPEGLPLRQMFNTSIKQLGKTLKSKGSPSIKTAFVNLINQQY
jgi:hypothetical protein